MEISSEHDSPLVPPREDVATASSTPTTTPSPLVAEKPRSGPSSLRQRLMQRMRSWKHEKSSSAQPSVPRAARPSQSVGLERLSPPSVMESLPGTMGEVASIHSSLIGDVVSRANSPHSSATRGDYDGDGHDDVRLVKFFEFYKDVREHSLKNKLEKFGRLHQQPQGSPSCAPLSPTRRAHRRVSRGGAVGGDGVMMSTDPPPFPTSLPPTFGPCGGPSSTPSTPSAAQKRSLEYHSVMCKLREMAIEDRPAKKRRRARARHMASHSSPAARTFSVVQRHHTHTLEMHHQDDFLHLHHSTDEKDGDSLMMEEEEEEEDDCVLDDDDDDEVSSGGGSSVVSSLHHPRRVRSLVDICLYKCVEYHDCLPPLFGSDPSFPDELLQRMITMLIEQNALCSSTLRNLLSPTMTSLDLSRHAPPPSRGDSTRLIDMVVSSCPRLEHLYLSSATLVPDVALRRIGSCLRHIRTLDIGGNLLASDEGVLSLVRCATQLRTIRVSECPRISDEAVRSIIRHCGGALQVLDVHGCTRITDAAFEDVSSCKRLTVLNAIGCEGVSDETLARLGRRHLQHAHDDDDDGCASTPLEVLKVSGRGVTDDGIRRLLSTHGSGGHHHVVVDGDDGDGGSSHCMLREISLVGCNVSSSSIHLIARRCPRLASLDLSSCGGVCGDAFSSPDASRMYHLERLNLSRCLGISDDGLRALAGYCHSLSELTLSSCEDVTDGAVLSILEKNRGLRVLDVSKCRNITDASMCRVGGLAPHLRRIAIEGCEGVTSRALESIARGCTRVEQVVLHDLRGITERGVVALSACKALKRLDVAYCPGVTFGALQAISNACTRLEEVSLQELDVDGLALRALQGVHGLKHLNASYCEAMDDGALLAIAKGCPRIAHLDLSGCSRVTLAGLQQALDHWPALASLSVRGCGRLTTRGFASRTLQRLNVSWCKEMEDSALRDIVLGCPSLTTLDVAWCARITGSTVHRLVARSPRLRELNLRGCGMIPNLTKQFLRKAGRMVTV